MEKELRTLPAVEPVAKCGHCGQEVFADGKCQIGGTGQQPSRCCLNGDDWRQLKAALDMRNSYVRTAPAYDPPKSAVGVPAKNYGW